jgi:glycosyltransferase involved in cell wall biosynthesis
VRILHIVQPTDGGSANVVATLARHQATLGVNVAVACPSRGELASDLRAAKVPHFAWESKRSPISVVRELVALSAVKDEFRPDLVHLHSSKAGLVGRLMLRGRIPTIFQPHAWSFADESAKVRPLARRWEDYAARYTDVFVAVSADEREQGMLAGIDGKYAVIHNGIDLDRFDPGNNPDRAKARAGLGLLPDAPTVLVVGRLARQKGQDVLVRSWPEVRRQSPSATLILVGDGPQRETLQSLAPPGVILAGSSSNVSTWLAAANVVAIPSRWEGFALTAIEAMAAARSVVISDVAGAKDLYLDESSAGTVLSLDPPDAFCRALVDRLLHSEKADLEGKCGRIVAVERFGASEMCQAMDRLYRDVLMKRKYMASKPASCGSAESSAHDGRV